MINERRGEGYLLIDHNNSPGTKSVPAGTIFESPTITCSHCHQVVVLNPLRTRERHRCFSCFKYVCDNCAGILGAGGVCEPFEEKMRRQLVLTGELSNG